MYDDTANLRTPMRPHSFRAHVRLDHELDAYEGALLTVPTEEKLISFLVLLSFLGLSASLFAESTVTVFSSAARVAVG